jgi:eukaryotic-like serine/threonine-protein kinase
MNNLAYAYEGRARYAQAEPLLLQVLEARRRKLGPEDRLTLETLLDVADLYQRRRNFTLAESYSAQALAAFRHAFGSKNADTMEAAADLALAEVSLRKFPEGERLAREAVQFEREKEPADWQRFRAESILGASLVGEKKLAEAEPLLLGAYQGMEARKQKAAALDHDDLDRTRQWIVVLYQAMGKPDKAAEWKKKIAS